MPARTVEALVFDMDGTLFDSRTVVPDAYIDTILALGGRRYERHEIVEAYSIGPPKVMLTHLLGREATDEDVDRYLRRLDEGGPGVEVYPGIEEALGALRGRVPLAVYTGASTRAAELLLAACGLRRWFDLVVGADRVARPKPWPDGIELACLELGVVSKEAAYVGDAPADLEAARRSGALAVAAGWGHLYSPDEPADVVAATPAELVDLVERGSSP